MLKIFGRKLSSAKKFKVGQLELEELETEVKAAVMKSGANISEDDSARSVPQNQVQAAAALKEQVGKTGVPESRILATVRREVYDLAAKYEIARTMPRGGVRTRKMDEIAAGMRTLAIAGLRLRTELTRSDSVGKRLAAICMLQVQPRARYLRWLIERVKTESQPFVFFQAAVAILEMVKKKLYTNAIETRAEIADALRVISSYEGGEPDQSTVIVLKEAIELCN